MQDPQYKSRLRKKLAFSNRSCIEGDVSFFFRKTKSAAKETNKVLIIDPSKYQKQIIKQNKSVSRVTAFLIFLNQVSHPVQ